MFDNSSENHRNPNDPPERVILGPSPEGDIPMLLFHGAPSGIEDEATRVQALNKELSRKRRELRRGAGKQSR